VFKVGQGAGQIWCWCVFFVELRLLLHDRWPPCHRSMIRVCRDCKVRVARHPPLQMFARAWHAILAPFVRTGDNGKSQPNYSQWGGSFISASLPIRTTQIQIAALGWYSQISGLTWVSMLSSVWRKSLSWTNSQVEVSTNFEESTTKLYCFAKWPPNLRHCPITVPKALHEVTSYRLTCWIVIEKK
jgi:hypothetical protein